MDERRTPSLSRTALEITRSNFTVVRKGGLDPDEVHRHLELVAREANRLETKLHELERQLAEASRPRPPEPLDEATLATALGNQGAAILRAAHEEAGRVTAEAQERVTQILTESQQRGAEYLIDAQTRATAMITEAESTAAQIDHDARLAAERLIDSAKVNGEALIERAREQGRAIVEQANAAKKDVLNDLIVKRKALTLQIEQLRVARDTLGTYILGLRDQVDVVVSEVSASDELARAAALDVLRHRPAAPDPTEEELLANTPMRPVPELNLAPLAAPEISNVAADPFANPTPDELPALDIEAGDEESANDLVNEIFARLRQATLEERGVAETAPARPVAKVTDDAFFSRRDRALEGPAAAVVRKMKRAIQDDQNIALEYLRASGQLEDEHLQRARYADASFDALMDAASAGAAFAVAESGVSGGTVDASTVAEVATEMALAVAGAIRKAVERDGVDEPSDRANAAYREWRGSRVELLATDAARRAFHLGVISASAGRTVRFLVAPYDAPCDVCAAAAGDRPAGEDFAPGSSFPPLHAGCACSVVPL